MSYINNCQFSPAMLRPVENREKYFLYREKSGNYGMQTCGRLTGWLCRFFNSTFKHRNYRFSQILTKEIGRAVSKVVRPEERAHLGANLGYYIHKSGNSEIGTDLFRQQLIVEATKSEPLLEKLKKLNIARIDHQLQQKMQKTLGSLYSLLLRFDMLFKCEAILNEKNEVADYFVKAMEKSDKFFAALPQLQGTATNEELLSVCAELKDASIDAVKLAQTAAKTALKIATTRQFRLLKERSEKIVSQIDQTLNQMQNFFLTAP